MPKGRMVPLPPSQIWPRTVTIEWDGKAETITYDSTRPTPEQVRRSDKPGTRAKVELLLAMVTAWSFVDTENLPVPIDIESVTMRPRAFFELISAAMHEDMKRVMAGRKV